MSFTTLTLITNSNIYTRCSLCFIPAIAKTLSLTENLDFPPTYGLIEARQSFKIQARTEPNPTREARARLTTLA